MSENSEKCQISSVQRPTNIQLNTINDKESPQILTFEQLEPENLWHFYLWWLKQLIDY